MISSGLAHAKSIGPKRDVEDFEAGPCKSCDAFPSDRSELDRALSPSKREEYVLAGIPEYWIVDPELGHITVLTLEGQAYVVHGEFKRGERATSKLLSGFAVDVTSALAPKS